MEVLDIVKAPAEVARFVGKRLLGGGWANLPPVITRETVKPQRCVRIPENVILGEE